MDSPRFAERHPFWYVAILEIMLIVVLLFFSIGAALLGLSSFIVVNVILAIIGVIMLSVMRWWKRVGFHAPAKPQTLLLFLVWLIPIGVNLAFGVEIVSPQQVVILLVASLLVGFVAEGFFRGLMFQALRHLGPWQTVLLPSVLFGLFQALSVLSLSDPLSAVLQFAYAVAIGIGCAALVWRTGVIWPLVLGQTLTEFTVLVQAARPNMSPAVDNLIRVALTVIFLAYGLYLMLSRPAEQALLPAAEAPTDNAAETAPAAES